MNTTIWQCDCCKCVIEYNSDNINEIIKIINRCKMHKISPKNNLTKILLQHNKSFILKYGKNELSKLDIIALNSEKRLAKEKT